MAFAVHTGGSVSGVRPGMVGLVVDPKPKTVDHKVISVAQQFQMFFAHGQIFSPEARIMHAFIVDSVDRRKGEESVTEIGSTTLGVTRIERRLKDLQGQYLVFITPSCSPFSGVGTRADVLQVARLELEDGEQVRYQYVACARAIVQTSAWSGAAKSRLAYAAADSLLSQPYGNKNGDRKALICSYFVGLTVQVASLIRALPAERIAALSSLGAGSDSSVRRRLIAAELMRYDIPEQVAADRVPAFNAGSISPAELARFYGVRIDRAATSTSSIVHRLTASDLEGVAAAAVEVADT